MPSVSRDRPLLNASSVAVQVWVPALSVPTTTKNASRDDEFLSFPRGKPERLICWVLSIAYRL